MTEALPQFTLARPQTIEEALAVFQSVPDALFSAGGNGSDRAGPQAPCRAWNAD